MNAKLTEEKKAILICIQKYKEEIKEKLASEDVTEWEVKYFTNLIEKFSSNIEKNEYRDNPSYFKDSLFEVRGFRMSFYSNLPNSDAFHNIVRQYYKKVLEPEILQQKEEKKRHDYVIQLSGRRKLWVAEITGEDGGSFGLERRFLDGEEREYLSDYKDREKKIQFFCKNNKIYESCEQTGRSSEDRCFHCNEEDYSSYEEAKQALLAATRIEKKTITQSEFMKIAWQRAKELAGGSKGSKKMLSQAMKEIYKNFKLV